MKYIKNLKLSQKLISSFIMIAVLMTIVGVAGILNIKKINSNVITMYETDLTGVSDIKTVQENLLKIRTDILLILDEKNKNKFNDLDNGHKTVNR